MSRLQISVRRRDVLEPAMEPNLEKRNKAVLQFLEIAVNEYVYRTP